MYIRLIKEEHTYGNRSRFYRSHAPHGNASLDAPRHEAHLSMLDALPVVSTSYVKYLTISSL